MYNHLYTAAASSTYEYDVTLSGFTKETPAKITAIQLIDPQAESMSFYIRDRIKTVWQGIYSREFLLSKQIHFDEYLFLHEDELFLFDLFSNYPQVTAVSNCYYHYMQHNESGMHRFQENRLDAANAFASCARNHLAKMPSCPTPIKKELIRRISSSYFGVLLNEYGSGSPYPPRERRERLSELAEQKEFKEAVLAALAEKQLDFKRRLAWEAARLHCYPLLDFLCKAAVRRLS